MPAPASAPASGPDETAARQQRQLQIFGPILLNPSADIDAETRRNAATELVAMDSPEALDVLREALLSRRMVVASAAIVALQGSEHPPASLMPAAIDALETAPSELVGSLASILARYGEAAVEPLTTRALHVASPASARINAVTALGWFRSRAAASALMRVLSDQPGGDTDMTQAATGSLERMTGLAYGQDVGAWRSWWDQAARDSEEHWLALVSQSLARRVASLQQQIEGQRAASQQTSHALFETYRDLFPALPVEEQLRRLPRLLQDPLPPVREFGLGRVTVLARDSVRIPPDIADAVRARLHDETPALRQAAARLLDELNDDKTADAVAEQLAVERTPAVIATLLEVLSRRPTSQALEPAIRLLSDESIADRAADALWRMMLGPLRTPASVEQIRGAACEAAKHRMSPATLRLAALVANDRDASDLVAVLDHEDRRLHAAVAEGLWQRGLRQPLIDRADDESIYPFAIRAIADGPADLANFNLLIGLRPGDANRRLWCEMVVRLASRLSPTLLPAADDSLQALAYADAALRRDVLIGAIPLAREALQTGDRLRIVERLAPLLIDLGDAPRAWETLESLNGAGNTPTLAVPRFQAAALTGRYDTAAQIQVEPAAWLDLLDRESQREMSAPVAPRLYDEIVRRFHSDLGPEDRQRLERIGMKLRGAPQPG